jgi:hypothetical protein
MSNTIELLETIGRDAPLRYASRESLTQALDGMDANTGLRMAAAFGDRCHLVKELGGNEHNLVHNVNQTNGGYDQGDEEMDSESDQDGDETGDLTGLNS